MHKLREYRKLHELCWEPPEDLTRNHTEEEVEALRSKLNRRGGSKIETVYEIIRRKKWRMRAKIVMDQKANSIADLAATLLEHDRLGAESTQTEDARTTEERIAEERNTIMQLAKTFTAGSREKLERAIVKFEAALLPEVGASKKLRAAIATRNRRFKKRVDEAKLELKRAKWSHETVEAVVQQVVRSRLEAEQVEAERAVREAREALEEARQANKAELLAAKEAAREAARSPDWKANQQAFQETRLKAKLEAQEKIEEASKVVEEASKKAQQSAQPPDRPITLQMLNPEEEDAVKASLPRMPEHFAAKDRKAPVFSTEGVTVQWANILDAEFAEVWPSAVKHEPMGLVRNVPPRAPGATEEVDAKEEATAHGAAVNSTRRPPVHGPVHDLGTLRATSWAKKGLPTWLNEHNMGEEAYKEAVERDEAWAEYLGRNQSREPFALDGQSESGTPTATDGAEQTNTAVARKASLKKLNTTLVQQISRARGSRMPIMASSKRVRVRFQDAMERAQSVKKAARAS